MWRTLPATDKGIQGRTADVRFGVCDAASGNAGSGAVMRFQMTVEILLFMMTADARGSIPIDRGPLAGDHRTFAQSIVWESAYEFVSIALARTFWRTLLQFSRSFFGSSPESVGEFRFDSNRHGTKWSGFPENGLFPDRSRAELRKWRTRTSRLACQRGDSVRHASTCQKPLINNDESVFSG